MDKKLILIASEKISAAQLKNLCHYWFDDMVKVVVDIKKEIVALGGELHAEAEALLIEQGSDQKALWGANFYPWHEPENRIEFTALINIRPKQDNPSMEILDHNIKGKIAEIVERYVLAADEKLV
jgi:hypothetical protein